MKNRLFNYNIKFLFLFLMAICLPSVVLALPKDYYADSSVLASGRWAKIEVKETGMQLISTTLLKNLGFSDPDAVNVYGYGGKMLPERLNSDMPDDLPMIPSVRTAKGIVFFGQSSVGWEKISSSQGREYSHISNPYSDHAYYFISDVNPERKEAPGSTIQSAVGGEVITAFTERIAHEQDLLAPSNTGRLMLGEDFRVQNSRNFNFSLPGNEGDALMTVNFGAKSSAGQASLVFTANGEHLPATEKDKLASASSTKFIVTTQTVKTIENPGEKLNLNILFNSSGALSTAALDYIEIEYPREIRLENGELYFYISPSSASKVMIAGADENTIVWDVTDITDIRKVNVETEGENLFFNAPSGYSEYVAFNPANIIRSATAVGKITNQDIHSIPAPGMVIITPTVYKQAALDLATLHKETDGLDVLVVTPEEVYNEFSSGNPDVTAFRKMLKMWYDRAEGREGEYTEYCLIMSRPTYDNKMVTSVVKNAGYPRIPIWQSPTGDTESTSYSTDDYIGMLADNLSGLNMGTAKIHVAVGRMPVKSLSEANNAIKKLEKYLKEPALGSWRNQVMIIADDQDNGIHLSQAEECYEGLRSAGNGASFLYEKLYLDSYPLSYTGTGASYPEAKQRMLDKIAEGVSFINYIGHANPSAWGHEGLLTWTDITSMKNSNLPFIYASTCEFLRWDDDAISGAEEMWLNPSAGVIGMICPSRTVLISANGLLNKATSDFVFKRDAEGKGMRVGKIMIEGKNSGQTDNNKLRYGLIGDPSMRLPSPVLNVNVESINGMQIGKGEELPVIEARSTASFEGIVSDSEGNLLSDFNGIVELQLYDAEKVITTYGNGADGVESIYNDRKTRLYSGRAKVENGRWSALIPMPSEIENNYSPALMSMYAYDENGREANGANEDFYVYGFNKDAPEDFEGPEISEFYLNNPSFKSGDAVGPNPVLIAKVSDASGINLSDAGIGHSMVISIDDKTWFSDVALYYHPDENDPLSGSISYPLSDIEPGKHTLTLTVWDNANNSSSATLTFSVSAMWRPEISTLTTDVNPASSSVNFIIDTDGLSDSTDCRIDVYDLSGRVIWSAGSSQMNSYGNRMTLGWNLCDHAGARVPRGIYLYRATITTSEGAVVTKTRKLAVTAQ